MKVGDIIDRKYQIVKEIARGGFGVVYKGWDLTLKRLVAVKVIAENLEGDVTFTKMFEDEAYNTAKLTHDNIVQIYDFRKTKNNVFYIIMEFVKGKNLREVLDKLRESSKRLSPQIAAHITCEVLKALSYAHIQRDEYTGVALNIVHRDVNPANVMIYYDGRVKLTDFGVAKAAIRKVEATATGVLKGKISYMAPEQIQGKTLDARADIFATGLVLYEMLVGEKLFPVLESEFTTLQKIAGGEFTLNKLEALGIDTALIKINEKALATSPEERYQTAEEFSAMLEKYLHGHPVSQHTVKEFMERLFSAEIKREEKSLAQEIQALTQKSETTKLTRETIIETIALETPSEVLRKRKEVLPKRVKISVNLRKKLLLTLAPLAILFTFFFFISPFTFIILDTLPSGAELIVNGKTQGKTPVKFLWLKGSYKLIFEKEGYYQTEYQLKVTRRKFLYTSQGKHQEEARRRSLYLPLLTSLVIDSYPQGASITLDGKKLEEITPFEKTLPVGKHTLMLSQPGFKSLTLELDLLSPQEKFPRGWELTQTLRAGKKQYQIKANFGKDILVKSLPPGAKLYLDGKKLGLTPKKIYLFAEKSAFLKLEKAGFKTKTLSLRVTEDTPPLLNIPLDKYLTILAYDQDSPEKPLRVGVYLEGKLLGVTPLRDYPLPYKKIRLVFKKKGFRSFTSEYQIEECDKIIAYLERASRKAKPPVVTKREVIKGRILEIIPELPDTKIIINGEVKGKGQRVFQGLIRSEYFIALKHQSYPRLLTITAKFDRADQKIVVKVRKGKIYLEKLE